MSDKRNKRTFLYLILHHHHTKLIIIMIRTTTTKTTTTTIVNTTITKMTRRQRHRHRQRRQRRRKRRKRRQQQKHLVQRHKRSGIISQAKKFHRPILSDKANKLAGWRLRGISKVYLYVQNVISAAHIRNANLFKTRTEDLRRTLHNHTLL